MFVHVVAQGETVWSIAQKYQVFPQRIISDNAISNPQHLVVGQALLILIPKTVHTVRAGDTLSSIAAMHGIPVIQLLQNNPVLIANPKLMPGQQLVIDFAEGKRRSLVVNSYAYPYIDPKILRRALPYLTYLTIFGYGFTTEGKLIGIEDQPLIDLAYQYQTAPVMLLSSIGEDGTFSSTKASLLFNDVDLQNKVLAGIIDVMTEKGYVGLDIDFEYVEAKDADAYLRFLENAATQLHQNGFFLNTDLAPKASAKQAGLLYEAHDYPAMAAISDTVLLMTYEWGYTYGPPMAVAPLDKVSQVLDYAVTAIPPDKILMGIPNYGYDWQLPFEKGTTRATTIGNQQAIEIAARYGAEVQYDETAQSPYFEYFAPNGKKHVVWFEDVRSIWQKLDLADEFRLRGVGYWNVMRPFAQNWALISAVYQITKVV